MIAVSENSVAEFITYLMEYVVLALEVVIAIFIIVIVSRTLFDLFKKYVTGLVKKDVQQQQQLYNYKIVTRMLRGLLYSLDFLIAVDILDYDESISNRSLVLYSYSSDKNTAQLGNVKRIRKK